MRIKIILGLVAVCIVGLGAAANAAPIEYDQCGDAARPADVRIGLCTQVLQSGKLAENELIDVLRTRAALYNATKQYVLALADYKEAVRRAPDNVATYIARGSIYLDKLHKPDEAIDDYERALYLNPQSELALNGRANANRILKKYDLAIADMNKAIAINAIYWFLFLNRGYIFQLQGDYVKAKADYEAAIGLAPELWSPYAARAALYELTKRPDLAAPDYRTAYERGGDGAALRNKLREYGQSFVRGTPLPPIDLPLKVILLRGLETVKDGLVMKDELSENDIRSSVLPEMNAIWAQAGIRWNLVDVAARPIDDATLKPLLTDQLATLRKDMNHEERVKHYVGLHRLRDQVAGPTYTLVVLPYFDNGWVNYPERKVGYVGAWMTEVVSGDYKTTRLAPVEPRPFARSSIARMMSASLAGMMGLVKIKCEDHCLVGNTKRGYHISPAQIARARAQAAQSVASVAK